jgi:hypothetical protein
MSVSEEEIFTAEDAEDAEEERKGIWISNLKFVLSILLFPLRPLRLIPDL